MVAACSSTGDGDGSGGTGGKDPTGTNSTTGTMVTTGATMATTTTTTTTTGTGGAGGGAMCANGVPGFPPACQECLDASCCSQQQACAAEPECTGLLDCEINCPQGDAACIDACIAAAPVGEPLLNAFDDCFGGPICGLPDACNVPQQAPICDSGLALPLDQKPCADCLGQPGCCEDVTACADDPNCLLCLTTNPPTPESMAGCNATMLDEAVNVCFGTTCAAECG